MTISSSDHGLHERNVLPGQVVRERTVVMRDRNATEGTSATGEASRAYDVESDDELPFTD
jgi:hypothetical protein